MDDGDHHMQQADAGDRRDAEGQDQHRDFLEKVEKRADPDETRYALDHEYSLRRAATKTEPRPT
ncbi:hypothetical protein GCM10023157_08240 [Gluconacetobacter asukensis]